MPKTAAAADRRPILGTGSRNSDLTSVTHAGISMKRARILRAAVLYSLLIAGSAVILMPFWWMIATSLKSMDEIMAYPPTFVPKEAFWSNYAHTWNAAPFTQYTLNTLFLAVSTVAGNVLVNSFVAYGFAKIDFRGKKFWFALLLATMMIPGFVTLIPQYIFFSKLNLVGTYYPLILPAFLGNAFFIFLVRQFYMGVPNDLIEAAKIDGASHFRIWLQIMIPLAKPALIAVAIFSFNGAWNDFLGPLLYVNDETLYTLQIGLQTFKTTLTTQWNYLMAGSVLVLLPVIVLFFLMQKYFIEGMNLQAGTKG
ncbi:carbohydrate ABC transporter permease [Paenibacillus gansuensis]|uniref:Carbohydrate ABC transporter permease n=1 Tax=Paenibacillus gansuensis TaxID=306542 RepID=A0ABW5PDI6_9BACL